MIVVAPAAIALATPAVLTVATLAAVDDHAAVSVTSALVPSVRIATALYCSSSPARRSAGPGPGSRTIDATGAGSGPPADTVSSTGGAVAGSKLGAERRRLGHDLAGRDRRSRTRSSTSTVRPAPVSSALAGASGWPTTNGIATGCGPFDTVSRMSSKRPTAAPATASCASTVPAGCARERPPTHLDALQIQRERATAFAASSDCPTTSGTVRRVGGQIDDEDLVGAGAARVRGGHDDRRPAPRAGVAVRAAGRLEADARRTAHRHPGWRRLEREGDRVARVRVGRRDIVVVRHQPAWRVGREALPQALRRRRREHRRLVVGNDVDDHASPARCVPRRRSPRR